MPKNMSKNTPKAAPRIMFKVRPSAIPNPEHANFPRAGFARRIGALLYDFLVIVAVIMLATAAALGIVALLVGMGIITLHEGVDHASVLEGNWLYRLYLLAVIFWFYAGFWKRGGQTLGMRTWRLKVQNDDGSTITWRQALIRFVTALFGISNLGVLFNNNNLAWHDALAKCEVVVLSDEANKLRNWKKFA